VVAEVQVLNLAELSLIQGWLNMGAEAAEVVAHMEAVPCLVAEAEEGRIQVFGVLMPVVGKVV
jgi:hypothetical protein